METSTLHIICLILLALGIMSFISTLNRIFDYNRNYTHESSSDSTFYALLTILCFVGSIIICFPLQKGLDKQKADNLRQFIPGVNVFIIKDRVFNRIDSLTKVNGSAYYFIQGKGYSLNEIRLPDKKNK